MATKTTTEYTRDDRPHAELLANEAGQQVALVVVDHRDQHVAASDLFALEQPQIGPVALQHQRIAECRREHLAPLAVVLHDGETDAGGGVEVLRETVPNVAPTDDRHPARTVFARSRGQLTLKRLHGAAGSHEDDLVAGVERRPTARNRRRVGDNHPIGQIQL